VTDDDRLLAAAVCLQIYGGMEPDTSRYLAERVVQAVDRAQTRGHSESGPTPSEVERASRELECLGVVATDVEVHHALFAALCPDPAQEPAP
jgi:hypothetical protein